MPQRPPERETRQSIERALAEQRRKQGVDGSAIKRRRLAQIEQQMAKMRDRMNPEAFRKVEAQFRQAVHKISVEVRRRRRRPGESGVPALVEPPRGPKPFQGGAAAPLEFDS